MTTFLLIGPQQIILIVLGLILFPVIALIDLLRNEFTGNNKLIWVLVILFMNFIGAILYFTMGRKHKIKSLEQKN